MCKLLFREINVTICIIVSLFFTSCASNGFHEVASTDKYVFIGKTKNFSNTHVLDAGDMFFQGEYEFEIVGQPRGMSHSFLESSNRNVKLYSYDLYEIDSYKNSKKKCPSVNGTDDLYQVVVEKIAKKPLSNANDNYLILACTKFDENKSQGFILRD